MGPSACWALHPWLPKVSGMFPTLLPAVLALFVVRGCGSQALPGDLGGWGCSSMGRDRSAPSRQGQGRSKDVHSAVLVTLCIRVVNRSIGGVGTLSLLHLALRAPGGRYTGHVGGLGMGLFFQAI